ncbi:MAG: hypothetical protein CO139_02565, partial [Candidatus Moranbacteria bacterium CG_4_9_14_3_um_filter_36_9]
MKIICILFHVGKNKNEITKDSKLRLFAGFELAKENRRSVILFIGGGGLKVSGAELMEKFWIKNFPEIRSDHLVLNSSNNTFDNLNEIRSFLKKQNILFSEIGVVTNSYHVKRLQKIINKLDLKATILIAENILISKNKQCDDVKKYLNSVTYRRKIFLELFLRAYLFLDSKQRVAHIWRCKVSSFVKTVKEVAFVRFFKNYFVKYIC